jgi:hypothetical protein
MALTWPRWIAIATGSALVVIGICFARMSRQVPPTSTEHAMWNLAETYAGEAHRMAARYRVLLLRDSLQAKGLLATEGQRVIVDPRLDGPARLEIESAIRRANTLASIPAPRTPVVVAFVIDTARSVRGVSLYSRLAVHYLLPSASLSPCTVLVRVGSGIGAFELERVTRQFHRDPFVNGLLGPCAFYAAFGPPGADITQWLRKTGYAFTLAADWSVSVRSDPHAFSMLGRSRWREDWNPGDDLPHCRAQKPVACSTEIQAIRGRDMQAVWGGVVDQVREDRFLSEDWRGVGGRLLSDMVRQYGEERFARFWRSDLPVADAFREATGDDLGLAGVRYMKAAFVHLETGPNMSNDGLRNGVALLAVGLIGTFVAVARTRVV